jgi:serine/threonine protein kinase/Flp pilus assembly protein TadD
VKVEHATAGCSIDNASLAGLPEAEQERLAQILDEYLISVEKGEPIRPEELLARYPEDADRLRGYLSGLELFHAAAIAPQAKRVASLVGGGLEPSQTIGDFQLVREIGRGGMGVVYEAEQISLRRRVALKILPFTVAHHEKQISRFKNEAQAAAQVKHPNIVPVYAVGEEGGVHYYAMQLVDGQSLTTMLTDLEAAPQTSTVGSTAPNHLHSTHDAAHGSTTPAKLRKPPRRRPLPMGSSDSADHVRAVARLGVQAAEALHAAHEYGVVHRDVKPSNLLVDDRGKLWVTDFGLARCRENAGLTQTGDILGTMRYMSPEQALGQSELVDHRTDVYSLGVTLYELASQHHPAGDASDLQLILDRSRYQAKPLRQWNKHIPVDFQTIVLKAIAEVPQERYANAQKLADDLNRFLEGQPILASPPSLFTRAGKWARRHRHVVTAAAAIMLVAFLGQSVTMLMLAKQKGENARIATISRQNLLETHQAIDELSTNVADQLAAIPGAEGVRYQVIDKLGNIFEQFERQAAGEEAFESDLADNNLKLASVAELLGKRDEALTRLTAARNVWQRKVVEEPENPEYAIQLAKTENNLGLLESELGAPAKSLAALEHAAEIQRKLYADSELGDSIAESDVSTDLAKTYSNIGFVLKKIGRNDEAVANYRQAIALGEDLRKRSPQEESILRGLAAAYNNLASLLAGPPAEVAAETAIEIQKKLVHNSSVNRIYQGELARMYNTLGFALARRGEWQKAELCYRDAIRVQKHLVEQSPLAASYRGDLAISYNNLGMVESRGNRLDEAEASFRLALEQQRLLLAVEPGDVRMQSNVGGVYNNLGLLFERRGRLADAEAAYERAIKYQKQAFDAAPTDATYRDLLGNHYANYAKCLRDQQKLDAAKRVTHEREVLLAGMPQHANVGL